MANRSSWKIILIPFVAFVVLASVATFIITNAVDEISGDYQKAKETMSAFVGEKLEIGGETHTITNFNVVKENFTTDKGIEIDKAFVTNYFEDLLDSTTVQIDKILEKVDGTRIELKLGNDE